MPDVPRITITGTSSVRRRKGWLTRGIGPVAGDDTVVVDWTPNDLTAGKYIWLDPNDLTSMWESRDNETIPATVGNPVSRMRDQFNNYLFRAGGQPGPILRQAANGNHYLDHNGVDTYLRYDVTNDQTVQAQTNVIAYAGSMDGVGRPWSGSVNGADRHIAAMSSGELQLWAGQFATPVPGRTGGNQHVVTRWSGATSYVKWDSGSAVTVNPGTNGCIGLTVGCSASGANFADIDVYGIVFATADVTGSDLTSLETWLGSLYA